MFGSALTKIGFEWIDCVKLIMDKSELNIKWFMFGCICVIVDLTITFRLKSIVETKSYKFYGLNHSIQQPL